MRFTAALTLALLAACKGGGGTRTDALPPDRWVLVADGESVAVFVDTRTILKTDTTGYRVWHRWRFPKDQAGISVTAYRPYRFMLQRTDIDCLTRRLRIGEVLYYDSTARGRLDSTVPGRLGNNPESSNWVDVIPTSLGEEIVDGTCATASKTLRTGVR